MGINIKLSVLPLCLTCVYLYFASRQVGIHDSCCVCRCDTTQPNPSWVSVAPMHTERGSLAVTTLGDYMYACGGGKPTAQFETVERSDAYPTCVYVPDEHYVPSSWLNSLAIMCEHSVKP